MPKPFSLILLLLLTLILTRSGYTQAPVSFSFESGGNLGRIYLEEGIFKEDISVQPMMGFNSGFRLGFQLSENAIINTGFSINNKRFSANLTAESRRSEIKTAFHSLSFPVSFLLRQPVAGNFYIQQQFGFSFDIHETTAINPAQTMPRPSFYLLEMSNRAWSFGLIAGLSLQYKIRNNYWIYTGITYNQGISKSMARGIVVYDNGDNVQQYTLLTDGSYLGFTLGLTIPAGKFGSLFKAIFKS